MGLLKKAPIRARIHGPAHKNFLGGPFSQSGDRYKYLPDRSLRVETLLPPPPSHSLSLSAATNRPNSGGAINSVSVAD
jgi:hypothetical protein